MGSDVHVILAGSGWDALDGLPEWVRARLARLERCWSRFLPDSEISLLNGAPGTWQDVSGETVELVRRGLLARTATDRRFDPTLLEEVRAAGYTSSLAPVDVGPVDVAPVAIGSPDAGPVSIGPLDTNPSTGPEHRTPSGAETPWRPGQEHRRSDRERDLDPTVPVDVDVDGSRLRVRPGVGFDPGGIAKGFAADLVCAEVLGAGALGVCINIGGDLRVSGAAPDGAGRLPAASVTPHGSWIVEVEHPLDPAGPPVRRLSLSAGAVATSSRCRRRWRLADGSEAHHIIDPTTGRPAGGEVLTATVIASEGWIAEALATASFLAGAEEAARMSSRHGATGLLVTADDVVELPGLEGFVAGPVTSGGPGCRERPVDGRTPPSEAVVEQHP